MKSRSHWTLKTVMIRTAFTGGWKLLFTSVAAAHAVLSVQQHIKAVV